MDSQHYGLMREHGTGNTAGNGLRWLAFCVLGAIAFAFMLYGTRGQTYWGDELGVFVTRPTLGAHALFGDQGGHLVLVPILLYRVLLELFGADSYTAIRVLCAGLHVAIGAMLFSLLARRVPFAVALAGSTVVLFFGAGWETVGSAYGSFAFIVFASGLGALLLLERDRRRDDILACVLLVVAVGTQGLGLLFVAASGTALALRTPRPSIRTFYIPAIPALLYGIWTLAESPKSQFALENLASSAKFTLDGLAATIGAITGVYRDPAQGALSFDTTWGRILGAALLGGALVAAAGGSLRARRESLIPLTALASFWLLSSAVASSGRPPFASRYLYPSAIFAILTVAYAFGRRDLSPRWQAALVAVVVIGLPANILNFQDAGDYFRGQDAQNRAEFALVEASVGVIDPSLLIEDPLLPEVQPGAQSDAQFTAQEYLNSVSHWGSMALPLSDISSDPQAAASADAFTQRRIGPLAEALPPAGAKAPPIPGGLDLAAGTSQKADGCYRLMPAPGGLSASFSVPGTSVTVEPGPGPAVALSFSRWATTPTALSSLSGESSVLLRFPESPGPAWRLQVQGGQLVKLCAYP